MKKARLLIIDDNPAVRDEVRERIESLGHESDEAACQEQALKKIEDMQYDCVLLDLEIPVKFEGVTRIDHGKHLLERIVTMPDPPPVIVITSHGLDGHKLAVEMMRIGAKDFVGKPFDKDPLEPKIRRVLESMKDKSASRNQASAIKPFSSGVLVMNEDCIELCGISVGGKRANAMIREVVQLLSMKKNSKFRKLSAKDLVAAMVGSTEPAAVTAAINDFREQCIDKLREAGIECGKLDVIQTAKGGGYQFAEGIQVRLGTDGKLCSEVEDDCTQILRFFNRHKTRTVKQVRDAVEFPALRVKGAMATLEKRGKIKNIGGSGSTTTYEATQS